MTRRGVSGYTMIEMTVGVFLSLIVVLALGKIIQASSRTFGWGQDKTVLQQNTTEALKWMARSVRSARSLSVASLSEFSTKDTTGAVVHNYKLQTVSGVPRLRQDGANLVDRRCTQFRVRPNADTTSLTIKLELQDNSGNLVGDSTRVTIRNRTFEF
jgi:hypothetical protein